MRHVYRCVLVAAALLTTAPSLVAQGTPAHASTAATVDLNAASSAELQVLPGIGPATATRIIEYRQKNGDFQKIEELMNVQGIGEKTFLQLRPLITVAKASGAARQSTARK